MQKIFKKNDKKDPKQLVLSIQETMTNEPIPKQLFPADIQNLLIIYDFPQEKEDMDPVYIYNKLYPEWVQFTEAAPKIIKSLKSELDAIEKKITSVQKPKNFRHPINFINADYVRQFHVLYPEFTSTKNNLSSTRVAILQQRINMLTHLCALCEELIKHPRYVHIKLYTALQNYKSIEADYLASQYLKYHSLKFKLTDLESQILFIPKVFDQTESNIELVKHLVTTCVVMADPQSGYLPYIEECDILTQFLKSKMSPIHLKDEIVDNELTPEVAVPLLHKITHVLCDFIGLQSGKTSEERGLNALCARSLFNQYMLMNYQATPNEKFQNILLSLNGQTITQLGLATYYIPKAFLLSTPIELVHSTPTLNYALQAFQQLQFLVTPMDVAYYCYIISLSLASTICDWTQTQVDYSSSFDDMFIMWKLLFIAAQDVGAEIAISSIQKWDTLDAIAPLHKNSCLIPRAVILSLSSKN